MPPGRLEKLRSPSANAAHPPLRAELHHLHSLSAQGRSVPPERAFGDTGRSDGSSPYKDCQMRLKGGREAGHAHYSLSSRIKPNAVQTAVAAVTRGQLSMALAPLLTGSTAPHQDTQAGGEETSHIPSLPFGMQI